jgi:carboxyl-terminal processing protease
MKHKRLFNVFLSVIVAGAFAAGVFQPELQAQGGWPEVFSRLRPSSNARDLDPLTTYNRVLQVVQEKYYDELPNDKELTYAAVRGMLNTLDDPYTRFLDPKEYRQLRDENQGSFEGVGASLAPRPDENGYIHIVRPIRGGPAATAGIQRGDRIMKIDGKSVVGMSVDEAVGQIRGRAGTVVKLTIKRDGEKQPLEFSIRREPVEHPVLDYRMDEGNIGYIGLTQFNELADQKVERAIRELERDGMKGLVLDLRGNPGGLLDAAIDISSRFVPSGRNVVIIVESGGDREVRQTNPRKQMTSKVPVVVLVNKGSASASEIVAGAVKDNKTGTVVGTTTFGKGLVQTVVPLEDGSACMITTAKYLTPSGLDINRGRDKRGGVDPDIQIEVTEEQFFRGEDPQLAKALELLHQRIGYRRPAPASASADAR